MTDDLAPKTLSRMERSDLAEALADALSTGVLPHEAFAPDVVSTINVPHWQIPMNTADELAAMLASNIRPGEIEESTVTPAGDGGFVLELATRVPGPDGSYCRMLGLVETSDGVITKVTGYCTGDWSRETYDRWLAAQGH